MKVFDRELIEKIILENPKGKTLAKRDFPISFSKWEEDHPRPANIFSEYEPLSCNNCGRDLLPQGDGIIEEAFRSLKQFILRASQMVLRNQNCQKTRT